MRRQATRATPGSLLDSAEAAFRDAAGTGEHDDEMTANTVN
jgi:hypothetical protein